MLTATAVARQLGISARKVYDLHAEGANCASVSNFFPVMGRCYPAGVALTLRHRPVRLDR